MLGKFDGSSCKLAVRWIIGSRSCILDYSIEALLCACHGRLGCRVNARGTDRRHAPVVTPAGTMRSTVISSICPPTFTRMVKPANVGKLSRKAPPVTAKGRAAPVNL